MFIRFHHVVFLRFPAVAKGRQMFSFDFPFSVNDVKACDLRFQFSTRFLRDACSFRRLPNPVWVLLVLSAVLVVVSVVLVVAFFVRSKLNTR